MKIENVSLKIKGFTLVELVITIAIVIILSVVSVPIYQGYTRKAKMAEGYALLGLILSAQKNYYSEYGVFLDDHYASPRDCWTCKEDVLGIDARGNKYFTCFHYDSNDTAANYLQSISAWVLKPKELIDNGYSRIWIFYDVTSSGGVTIRETN